MTRRLAALALLWLAAVLVFVAAATSARADAVDDAFIATLDERGITYPSPAYVIRGAHAACDAMDSGWTVVEVAAEIDQASDLSPEDAAYLTGAAAVAAYCPWHMDEVIGQKRIMA